MLKDGEGWYGLQTTNFRRRNLDMRTAWRSPLRILLASKQDNKCGRKGPLPYYLTFFFFQAPPPRLTCEEFKQLLAIVRSKSLKNEDAQLIPLLSMRTSWYLNLFRWDFLFCSHTKRIGRHCCWGLLWFALLFMNTELFEYRSNSKTFWKRRFLKMITSRLSRAFPDRVFIKHNSIRPFSI